MVTRASIVPQVLDSTHMLSVVGDVLVNSEMSRVCTREFIGVGMCVRCEYLSCTVYFFF